MNKVITVLISGASFFAVTQAFALSQATAPNPMSIVSQATMFEPAQIQLAKKEGGKKERKLKKAKKDKKIKGTHENKGKHKGHGNNEHSNSGDGKLKGLERADEVAGEHGHRDKASGHGKHKKD